MEINYEVKEEDYIKFNIHHARNLNFHKKTYLIIKYLLPLFCAIAIFFIGQGLFKQPKFYWSVISILYISIWIIKFPKIYERLITKSSKEMLKSGDSSSILCKNKMIIDEKYIKVISEHSTEITSKEGIKEVKVYDDMVLIYLSGFTAHIVPTRYLSSETKEELLKELSAVINS